MQADSMHCHNWQIFVDICKVSSLIMQIIKKTTTSDQEYSNSCDTVIAWSVAYM